jgi:hypothetical protein
MYFRLISFSLALAKEVYQIAALHPKRNFATGSKALFPLRHVCLPLTARACKRPQQNAKRGIWNAE